MWRRSFSSTSDTFGQLTKKKWDAVVIGGGHNGLTAAAYLARGGLSVAVLERRHVIGGAAVTEEIVPGFKFSRCSYLQSLLRPCIIRDLELGRHGMKLLKRSPSSFTPCLDGRYLLLGQDKQLNHSEISKFSKNDAEAYPRYEKQLERFCGFMDPLLDAAPPESLQGVSSFSDKLSNKMEKSAFWARCLWQAASLGQKDMVDFLDLLLAPASKVLNNWFESDVLKASLATDAVIGSTASVHTPGSGYVLLHHVMGETDGEHGIWSYVEGGMGSVSMAIANAAKEAGAQIFTNAEVSEVLTEDSSIVKGVLLADGKRVESSVILSNATPYRTFVELVPTNVMPENFVGAIKNSDYSSATTKINLAVDKLPQFQCCNTNNSSPGPEHFGTIHIGAESMDEVHSACHDAENGLPSRRPVIEMSIPSTLDNTISPPGKHVINLFIQYTPYKPSDGSWEDPIYREAFAQRCFKLIDEYAPGFSSSIISYDMLTPPDLEREIGLTGGNIFHGAMGLDSLFLMRPVKGWSSYRSPLKGLYLCGSGAHPGGGVMGAPGRNAARVVLQDLKRIQRQGFPVSDTWTQALSTNKKPPRVTLESALKLTKMQSDIITKRAKTSAPQKVKMISLPLRDDDEENNADEAKMLLIGGNGINGESSSPLRDDAPELQQYNIHSIESTVVIRQLTSQGLSFQLWPAASTFVTLLDNYRRDPRNSPLTATLSSLKSSPLNILELGSGTGIVGIAAAVTLSANVTVTDLPHVLDNLNFNSDANAEVVARFGGKVNVAPLRWGEADDVEILGRNVDLILASDVVYHDHLYEPLLKTLRLMMTTLQLEGKRLIFLMAHLRRWKKESVFFKKARKLFDVDIIHSDVPQEGSRIGVVVYRCVTKQPNQNGRIVSC